MELIALISIALLKGCNVIFIKLAQRDYIKKSGQSIYLIGVYSFFQCTFMFLLPPYIRLEFNTNMIIYPVAFSIFYFLGSLFLVLAIKAGPVSLTNIINTYHIMIPILAGFILWNDGITVYQGIGLLLFIINMYLFSKGVSKNNESEDKRASTKWLVMATASSLLIGSAVIFSKQYMFHSENIKEYLIIYSFLVCLISAVYLVVHKTVRGFRWIVDWKFYLYIAIAAIVQDVSNIIYLFFISRMQSVYFFPLIAMLSIIVIVLASRIVLKENIRLISKIAVFLSIISIYLLGLR